MFIDNVLFILTGVPALPGLSVFLFPLPCFSPGDRAPSSLSASSFSRLAESESCTKIDLFISCLLYDVDESKLKSAKSQLARQTLVSVA